MSTPSSHQQLEDEEEEEKLRFEESHAETGQQKTNATPGDEITGNYTEPQMYSTEQDSSPRYKDEVSQDNVTVSPASQEYSSSYSKFPFCLNLKQTRTNLGNTSDSFLPEAHTNILISLQVTQPRGGKPFNLVT